MITEFLGLKMNSPIIISAGPWNRDGESIRRGIAAGAGAVVTESVVSDTLLDVRPRIAYDNGGAENIRLYSDIQVEGWAREMSIAKSNGGIVISSISAHTASELSYLAMKMEKFGADAIELSVSSPMGESLEVLASDPDRMFELTSAVVKSVSIPVMVKLSQNVTNISKVAKAVKKAGGSGVSAINTIRCILGIEIETMRPMLPTYGGYSGAPVKPIGLASVATIAQTVDIPVCGIGGICDYKNALEYIMAGASAVQVGTAVMLGGLEVISKMNLELDEWLRSKNIKDISQIRGKALDHLKSWEEIKIEPVACAIKEGTCEATCEKCVKCCIYDALKKDGEKLILNKELCSGCGLCTFVCPDKKIYLDW